MRKIKIECATGYYGKLRALKLIIDGNEVGSINQGGSVDVEISDNAVELRGKMDWGKTCSFSLTEVKEGDVITFQPYFTLNPLRNLGITDLPIRIR